MIPINNEDKQLQIMKWINHFGWSDQDSYVHIPNEIFKDLSFSSIKTFRHKAFAYSFYYLSCYLYRNAKYGSLPLSDLYSLNLIELMYGDRKPINYITKRKGVLDQIGYTTSENDFPMSCIVEDDALLGFSMYSEQDQESKDLMAVPSNFICKRPLKAFYRFPSDDYYTGTFFEFENTHRIDFTIFARCMSAKGYGFEYFYVYSFLNAFEDFINSKERIYKSYITLSLDTSPKTTNRILKKLVDLKLIKIDDLNGFKYKTRKKIKIKQ